MNNLIKNVFRSYRQFYHWDIENNFFIVSTGRTATNFLAHFFNKNFDDVLAVHEPSPDLFDLHVNKFRKRNTLFSTKAQIKMARYRQYQTLRRNEVETYVESNPNLSFLLPEIKELFPNPKILFVSRDLPYYLISAYNKSPDGSNQKFFYADNDHRDRITPIDLNDDEYADQWETMSRAEKIAWYWNSANNYILENIQDTDHLHVKYKDLFPEEDSDSMIGDVLDFFDLEPDSPQEVLSEDLKQRKNTNSRKIITSIDDLDREKKEHILEMSYDTRKELDYI